MLLININQLPLHLLSVCLLSTVCMRVFLLSYLFSFVQKDPSSHRWEIIWWKTRGKEEGRWARHQLPEQMKHISSPLILFFIIYTYPLYVFFLMIFHFWKTFFGWVENIERCTDDGIIGIVDIGAQYIRSSNKYIFSRHQLDCVCVQ